MAREVSGSTGVIEIDLERYYALWGEKPVTADWFCLKIEPWRCMNCGTTLRHYNAPGGGGEHFIVVWPTRDDPNMHTVIGERGGKAAIVSYEDALGPSVSWYSLNPS